MAKAFFHVMSRNKITILLIIILCLIGAGYFYLVFKTFSNDKSFLKKTTSQTSMTEGVELNEAIFKNLETDIITVGFSDDTTGAQAKEILASLKLNYSTLDNILESSNYQGWLTGARIHVWDSIVTARLIAEKAKTFQSVFGAEEKELHYSIQSLYPERERYFVDITFIDGIDQDKARSELNNITQSRLVTPPSNPTVQEIASRTEIFAPRKDINVTIKNLTSTKAYSTCQQLLAIKQVVSCTPFSLLN